MAGAYVMMKPKVPEQDEIVTWKPTKIAAVQRCEHVTTVCTECLSQWEHDYVLRHNRISADRLGRAYGVSEGEPA